MIKKIDHIGIVVNDLEESIKFYQETLGLKLHESEFLEDCKLQVAFFPIGDTDIELLQATSPDSIIAKFVRTEGQGVQHIAFVVENIDKSLEELKSKGIELIDEKPRLGARGARIAFLHPNSTQGVLIELCERK